MGQLSLTLLAAPSVYHAGKALTFPTRKALALLVYQPMTLPTLSSNASGWCTTKDTGFNCFAVELYWLKGKHTRS